MKNPFQGITVLDFTHVYSGPYCTMLLADLGMRVIKIERPRIGDDVRSYKPFRGGESAYFAYVNRNKESVVLDLKSAAGRRAARELMKKCDIVVENFSVGTMQKMELDYDSIKEERPDLIYASISGFGQTGPLAHRAAYDVVAQAMSGILRVTGFPDTPPVKVGVSITDANAGVHCALSIMAALYYRDKTGRGQYIDVSMMEAAVSVLENFVVSYTVGGTIPKRNGNAHNTSAPFDVFSTKDDYVAIAAATDDQFARMEKALGTHFADDERFTHNADRVAHYDELRPLLEEHIEQYTTDEIVACLDAAKVSVAPLLNMEQIVHNPQLRHRGTFVTQHHPVIGDFESPGFPAKFSELKTPVRKAAPLLGEDTDDVLSIMLGMDEAERKKAKGER